MKYFALVLLLGLPTILTVDLSEITTAIENLQKTQSSLIDQGMELSASVARLEVTYPTAEELSEPGALQAYCDDRASRGLKIVLPPGYIRNANVSLAYYHGVEIVGSGCSHVSPSSKNGWRTHPQVKKAFTILVSGDATKPVIRLAPCMELKLSDFSIKSDGIGVDWPQWRGWGGAHLKIDSVNFHDCSVGLRAGREKSDHNAADASFHNCTFDHCGVGLQVNHNQGVNYVFTGLNYFYDVPIAVHLRNGGAVVASSLHGYGVKTWCRMEGGGSNLNPQFYCQFIYSDRSLPSKTSYDLNRPYPVNSPPVILDAYKATGTVKAYVGAVKGTWDSTRDGKLNSEHNFLLAPSHNNYNLVFDHPELSNLLKQANVDPVHAPNPYLDVEQ